MILGGYIGAIHVKIQKMETTASEGVHHSIQFGFTTARCLYCFFISVPSFMLLLEIYPHLPIPNSY